MTAFNREPVDYLAGEMPLHRYCTHHAAQTPERIALLWYGRTICWRELDQLSTRLAVQFRRLGVARGTVSRCSCRTVRRPSWRTWPQPSWAPSRCHACRCRASMNCATSWPIAVRRSWSPPPI